MNYKEILTEEAAEQFRREGAVTAVIILFNNTTGEMIRELEVDLIEESKQFAIAGRTPAAEAAMTKYFCGHIVNGEMWFPFLHQDVRKLKDIEKLLAIVADTADLNLTDLKWAYVNVH